MSRPCARSEESESIASRESKTVIGMWWCVRVYCRNRDVCVRVLERERERRREKSSTLCLRGSIKDSLARGEDIVPQYFGTQCFP